MATSAAAYLLAAALLWAGWATRPVYWISRRRRWVVGARRAPIPWRSVDFPLAAATVVVLMIVAQEVFAPPAPAAPVEAGATPPRHLIEVVISEAEQPAMLLLAGLAVMVVAPVFEELFFRVLMQDWLERATQAWRPGPGAAVLGTAAFFALLHTREPSTDPSYSAAVGVMTAMIVAELCAIPLLLTLLIARTGGAWRRYVWGGVWAIRRDLCFGLLAAIATAPAVFVMQAALRTLVLQLPEDWRFAPDPAPLLLLGLYMGWLRVATRRVTSPLVLHVAVNAASFAMALAAR